MPDHTLESGDSPELEQLFDSVAQATAASTSAPAATSSDPVTGDTPELQALFEAIAHPEATGVVEPAPAPAPVAAPSYDISDGDSPELQALFDSVAAEVGEHVSEEVVVETASEDEATLDDGAVKAHMYSKVGQLTRKFHDALRELGYDKSLERAASAIPDARDRLRYIATMTEQAAERALNATDRAKPLQDEMEKDATALLEKWKLVQSNQLGIDEFKNLVANTQTFLEGVPAKTQLTSEQLIEIVMAQDFQDLTGQVIKRVLTMVQDLEGSLVEFLMEYSPERIEPPAAQSQPVCLENGPAIDPNRPDVVANQQQVDDLLESLGF